MILDVGDLLILNGKSPLMLISRFPTRRFEYKEENSNKFWEIWVNDKTFTTRWGKIGTEGQSQDKSWGSSKEATTEHLNIIKEKIKKGYKDCSNPESFIYVFIDPASPGKKRWISYMDLDAYMKKYNVTVNKKK